MWHTKIPNREGYEEALVKLGVRKPGSTEWYSYFCSEVGHIRAQGCVGLYMSIKAKTAERYAHVQHYARYKNCEAAEEVLCVRHPHPKNGKMPGYLIVTSHGIGECPVCDYHTQDEYHKQFKSQGRFI
jgi:hypothetical protein